ncbi:MAG: DUF2070 family protein [Halobacteriaceae archaeon]
MTATQGDLADLSKYIIQAPRWYASVTFSLVIAALAGIAAFDSAYLLEDVWRGIFYIGIPTLVAALGTTPVDEFLGGQLTYNRSSFLALTCELIMVLIMTIAGIIQLHPTIGDRFVFDALIAGLAFIFAFRFLVILAVSRNSFAALLPASLQTVSAAVLLFIYSGTMRYLEVGGPVINAYFSRLEKAPPEFSLVTPTDFVNLGIMSMIYIVAAYILISVLDRPWKRALGVSVLDFVQGFVGHIAEGTHELEEFFEAIGERAVVPVTVLSFRRRDKTEKARFVLPMIHPGPMGEIGGGNLPKRVAETADGLAFPPHATAGHDFNLVTEQEVEVLIGAANNAYSRIEYSNQATPSQRERVGDAKIIGQSFDSSAFMAVTYSPEFADDIEYGVGLSAIGEARVAGLDSVLFADAHNCNNGLQGEDLGHVYPGSRRSFDTIQAAGKLAEKLTAAEQSNLHLGVAWTETDWDPKDGIGPLGIRVAVTEVAGQQTAYVLIDGNNMEPGLRERLVNGITSVDKMEILTTDTHIVNTLESTNQVGAAIDESELRETISTLIQEAKDDIEPVEAGMETEYAEVTVFGNDRTETLASHANAVVAMGGALAGAIAIAAMAITMLVLFLT